MSAGNSVLEFKRQTDLAAPTKRTPQTRTTVSLPADTIVVSSDSHVSIAQDIFYERFPSRMKDRAPRIWRGDGVNHIGFNGKSLYPPSTVAGGSLFDYRLGSFDLDARLADLDAEGVDKEIAFGNGIYAVLFHQDFEVRETTCRIYNEFLAEFQERAKGRFYGVGLINYWDISKTQDSIDELKALGLKTFLLPLNASKDITGRSINYSGEEMDPFWKIVEDAGLPVLHHIGEVATESGRNSVGTAALQNFSPFRKMFGEYTMGGILDRNPGLRVAWMEAGLNWVLSTIQDASFIYTSFRPAMNYEMQREIKDYWNDHMFASFMHDPLGLELIDRIGVDKALWASDYPHAESVLGRGWDAIQLVLDAVPAADAKKILSSNAMKLFNL